MRSLQEHMAWIKGQKDQKENTLEDTRYKVFKKDNDLYIVDKDTGLIRSVQEAWSKIQKNPGNTPTAPIARNPAPETKQALPAGKPPIIVPELEEEPNAIVTIPHKSKPIVVQAEGPAPALPVVAEDRSTDSAPSVINDQLRRRAQNDIITYRSSLSLIQTAQIKGNRLTGTIAVTNTGKRKLDQLELTLYVPIGDGEKSEEHHYVFGYGPGMKNPPLPSTDDNPDSVIKPIDEPAPPGGKGRIELKVTYLKFSQD